MNTNTKSIRIAGGSVILVLVFLIKLVALSTLTPLGLLRASDLSGSSTSVIMQATDTVAMNFGGGAATVGSILISNGSSVSGASLSSRTRAGGVAALNFGGGLARVYEDAGRDVRGIYDAFIKWGTATAQAADWLDPLATAKQDLSERARLLDGITSLDGPYKQVSDAAKECGIGEHFSLSYKMLSKFAHPTAMRILAPPDEKREALQRDLFFSQGCLFFTGAFHALEGQLRG